MKNIYLKSFASLILIIAFTGCVSTTQQVKTPTSHIVPANKARIIIQREGMFAGSACSHKISDNENYIGILGNGGVMKWDREPSSFRITAKEAKGFCGDFYSQTYNLKAGETYTFNINMMMFDRTLKLVSGQPITTQEQINISKIKTQQDIEVDNIKHGQQIQKLHTLNDLKGLKEYTEKYPSSVEFIEDVELRLALTGPKDMKIGDIRKLLKDGKSELIVISLIKRVKSPYKEFTIKEIDTLISMGLSDNVIATMIDVTTEINKDITRKQEQQDLLLQQKQATQQRTIQHQNTQQTQHNDSNPVMDTITEEVTKQGLKILLDNLF